ncbi:SAE2 C-terminal domain-containing protein [Aspergillus homomorphus CBS 101889]|uniref:SAE2-domain-containing protein n=1 Tax=Aspergillus homomorphus (strain CBS 101889) TaxID=1450537 RepID=A0A395HTN6_ASPHC|nr:SAE2-domain-containing protein [Aspergillus homomorphus CBS 101889]RAL10773.1 SAE2-domain-containing protein [Aspergillus homomorphus CBS 101889]
MTYGPEDYKVSTKFREFEAAYAPHRVLRHLSHGPGADHDNTKTEAIEVICKAYTALYGEAQELVKASCELRNQVKRYKEKLSLWQKCLKRDKFILLLDGAEIEFKRTRKVSIDGPQTMGLAISVPVLEPTDCGVTEHGTASTLKVSERHHADSVDSGDCNPINMSRTSCEDLLQLSSAQPTPIKSGQPENEAIISAAQMSISATRTSELDCMVPRQGPMYSTLVKDETMSPSPPPSRSPAGGIIGTQDLDKVGNAVETPRKRRKVRDAHVEERGTLLEATTAPTSQGGHTHARLSPSLSSSSLKRPAVLRSFDGNLGARKLTQLPLNSHEEAGKWVAKDYISSILDDGDESYSSLPSRKFTGMSEKGPSGLTLGVDGEPTFRRLHSLLDGQLPAKLELEAQVRTVGRLGQTAPGNGTRKTGYTSDSIMSKRDVITDSGEDPLRARPLHELQLKDFKINPEYNQGYDYAFHSVIRKRADFKCAKGCTRYDCCGKKFLDLARLHGLPADATCSSQERERNDQNVLRDFLGDEQNLIDRLCVDDRNHLLQEAKARLMANQFGRHRQQHPRARSPPGFWRTDMPSTQELVRDHEEAKRLERDLVKDRHRDATQPGGLWKFADE